MSTPSMPSTPSRRTVLRSSLAAGVSVAGARLLSAQTRPIGANDAVRVAVAGLRERGTQLLDLFRAVPGVRVVALCDVDPKILDREVTRLDKAGVKVAAYTDPRKLLERSADIDALIIATPNHWHALLTIWACQAGLDVFVEKPTCHNVWEGRRMIEAAAKYRRIVQAGTQHRSDKGTRAALEFVRGGQIGKVQWAHALWYRRRTGIGRTAPRVPDFLDYDVWCGPAPKEPITRTELHYDWHWVWPTGNGDLGNIGVHTFDLARWFAGHDGLPPRIMSLGGRFNFDDAGETPNTHLAVFDYPGVPVLSEIRELPAKAGATAVDAHRGISSGIVVQCEGGHFAGYRGGRAFDKAGKLVKQFAGDAGAGHYANFIAAVRSRKPAELNCPIEVGHTSTVPPLLANISYRTGHPAEMKAARDAVAAIPVAAEALARIEPHLIANNVDLAKTPLTLGPWLRIDPAAESITAVEGAGDEALKSARGMLRDPYRAPYIVPEKV